LGALNKKKQKVTTSQDDGLVGVLKKNIQRVFADAGCNTDKLAARERRGCGGPDQK
jgi:hypothetical protein